MADFIPKQYTKEPITIRIAPDKLAQIDAFAAKFNMSRSEFINQCIDYALNNLPQTQKRPPRSFLLRGEHSNTAPACSLSACYRHTRPRVRRG